VKAQFVGHSEFEMELVDAVIRRYKQVDDDLYVHEGPARWRHFVESDFMVCTQIIPLFFLRLSFTLDSHTIGAIKFFLTDLNFLLHWCLVIHNVRTPLSVLNQVSLLAGWFDISDPVVRSHFCGRHIVMMSLLAVL